MHIYYVGHFLLLISMFSEICQTECLKLFHSGNNLRKRSLGSITGPMSPTDTIIATYNAWIVKLFFCWKGLTTQNRCPIWMIALIFKKSWRAINVFCKNSILLMQYFSRDAWNMIYVRLITTLFQIIKTMQIFIVWDVKYF